MVMFHAGLDDMQQLLTEAEREKAKWQPVGDVLLEALQTEIDKVKVGGVTLLDSVSVSSLFYCLSFSRYIFCSAIVSLFCFHF